MITVFVVAVLVIFITFLVLAQTLLLLIRKDYSHRPVSNKCIHGYLHLVYRLIASTLSLSLNNN